MKDGVKRSKFGVLRVAEKWGGFQKDLNLLIVQIL